jgi:hypothetical protein
MHGFLKGKRKEGEEKKKLLASHRSSVEHTHCIERKKRLR